MESTNIIKTEYQLCPSCMEIHNVDTIGMIEETIVNNVNIKFFAFYKYCKNTDEYYEPEDFIRLNMQSAKDAYKQIKLNLSVCQDCLNDELKCTNCLDDGK